MSPWYRKLHVGRWYVEYGYARRLYPESVCVWGRHYYLDTSSKLIITILVALGFPWRMERYFIGRPCPTSTKT